MKTVVINWITCFITLRKTKSRYVGCELWWWVVDWLYYVTIMQHEPAIMVVCKTQNAWFHENRAVVEWTKLFCLKTHSVGDITYNVDKWAPQTEYILMNNYLAKCSISLWTTSSKKQEKAIIIIINALYSNAQWVTWYYVIPEKKKKLYSFCNEQQMCTFFLGRTQQNAKHDFFKPVSYD